MEFAFRDHLSCSVLLESMRGTVCAALFTGSPRFVRRGERIFDAGDASDALFQVPWMARRSAPTASRRRR